ncbi:hypothetical protein BCV70DRAFT_18196 [Testicularia cyperi]|uniref:Uncharacterized protein n=1 Tax=Testicularia cyperi TaxID=1882483 RepID=A0A317Y095_9BASI|nr:hypothetical protein BCV70DRAFT_18196 [Testicularia cyperi]
MAPFKTGSVQAGRTTPADITKYGSAPQMTGLQVRERNTATPRVDSPTSQTARVAAATISPNSSSITKREVFAVSRTAESQLQTSPRRSSWSPGQPRQSLAALPQVQTPSPKQPPRDSTAANKRAYARGFYIPPPGYQATPPSSQLNQSAASMPITLPAGSKDNEGIHDPDRTIRVPPFSKDAYLKRPPANWRPSNDPYDTPVSREGHGQGRSGRSGPQGELPTSEKYGGLGEWRPLGGGAAGGFEWIPAIRTDGSAYRQVQDVFARLVHSDWTVPQAQRVLSTWATLATLLAGTQTTLLTFYERDKTSAYIALSFAALFLEIYGALLAAVNIMISISLQASQASSAAMGSTAGGGSPGPLRLGSSEDAQNTEANIRIGQGFRWQWMGPAQPSTGPVQASKTACPAGDESTSALLRDTGSNINSGGTVGSGMARGKERTGTIALCILDRLTVACGIIIPLGGTLQLTGLTVYAIETHPGPAVYSLFAAILFAISMTLLGLGQGLHTGIVSLRSGRHKVRETMR